MLDRAPYEQCAKIEEEIKQLREEIDRTSGAPMR
jgi:flagellin-like hook-associated protein FlgL